ncbi:putative bifunctional diguanylate cyclase/phosphodiesterase [Novosphingobium sp. YAF33]|uniref:putative bifunctional diguanylate cyclase/phosphodiesterase n=1 Tax=Novosphingobium sp. YAF33 TaxID=3233082 RepID=UPI003F9B50A0
MALLTASFGAVLILLAIMTHAQDQLQSTREEQALQSAVLSLKASLRHDLQDYAKWDDAVRHISTNFAPIWIDDNVVAYLGRLQGYEHIFILNDVNDTVYSLENDKFGKRAAEVILGRELKRSIHRVRAMERSGSPIEAGFSRSDGKLVVYATAAVVPLTGKVTIPADKPTHMLVIAHTLDVGTLTTVTENLQLSHLRLTLVRPAKGTRSLQLRDVDGNVVGWLEWTPQRPGNLLLRQVAPIIMGLGVCSLLAAILILQNGAQAVEAVRQSELRARHHAEHDALTGLPNRRALVARISSHLANGVDLTLLFMDMDGFKDANDVYGHAAGDLLLRQAAIRLLNCADGAFVARAGGDEFAVLFSGPANWDTESICRRMIEATRAPFVIGSYQITLGISIGCANAHDLGFEDQDELMRRADVAMYAAKNDGKNCQRVYSVLLDERHLLRMKLESDLRASINREELYVQFQPIVASAGSEIVGVEALVRWRHPEHGEVPPDVFVPIAELSGLINDVGKHVLHQACLAMKLTGLDLAVNISPVQFWDHNLLEDVHQVLKETGFPPERLELEITESLLLRRPDKAAEVIRQLRGLGIRIALDDFGTGYASIGYLQRLKLDRIKIDKAFVAPLGNDPRAREMIISIVALANAFDAQVTVEGVETEDQAQIARAAGCSRMQGWHFGRPMGAAELNDRLGQAAWKISA